MSFIYAFTCDVCSATDVATPQAGYLSHPRIPRGWRTIDGRHCCSLACVAAYATEPDSFPSQQLDPDPFIGALTKALTTKVSAPAEEAS